MAYELRSARWLAAEALQQLIQPGDTVIDATMGNGHDTQYLAELAGPEGHVYAFDIQPQAVASARDRLTEAGLAGRCSLHLAGHEHIPEYVKQPVRAAVFNLGWLPGGDHRITTRWETTRLAVQACLSLLVPGGAVSICVYPGHEAGDEERRCLTDWLTQLRPQDFNVLHQRFLNAGPGAPEHYLIQKQRTCKEVQQP